MVLVLGLVIIVLLYRRIKSIGRLTVFLWAGVLLTVAGVLATGLWHFDPKVAFFAWSFWLKTWPFGERMKKQLGVGSYEL